MTRYRRMNHTDRGTNEAADDQRKTLFVGGVPSLRRREKDERILESEKPGKCKHSLLDRLRLLIEGLGQ
jgi:hypothetical protein